MAVTLARIGVMIGKMRTSGRHERTANTANIEMKCLVDGLRACDDD